jgi:hypothetical protein
VPWLVAFRDIPFSPKDSEGCGALTFSIERLTVLWYEIRLTLVFLVIVAFEKTTVCAVLLKLSTTGAFGRISANL